MFTVACDISCKYYTCTHHNIACLHLFIYITDILCSRITWTVSCHQFNNIQQDRLGIVVYYLLLPKGGIIDFMYTTCCDVFISCAMGVVRR